MIERGDTTMLSRVADSLYWMSRYLERAEHTARLIDVDLQLRLDQFPEVVGEHWLQLLEALHVPTPATAKLDSATLAHTLAFDRTNPSSIVSCIAGARENLRHVREQCSSEMWEQLNRLYLQINSNPPGESWILQSNLFFRSVQEGTHLFHGLADSTMSHGEGWQYIQLGRYVERTDCVAALVGTFFSRMPQPADQAAESEEYLEWVGLLKCCTAFEAYCKNYTAEVRPLRVAEFLLLNPEFPHSVRYSVDMVHAALTTIGELTGRKAERSMRLAGRLRATLSYSQIDEIMAHSASEYMLDVRHQCAEAHTAIHEIYFDYPVERAMVM
jgi:uncharacterized alpha-E superfamily protein